MMRELGLIFKKTRRPPSNQNSRKWQFKIEPLRKSFARQQAGRQSRYRHGAAQELPLTRIADLDDVRRGMEAPALDAELKTRLIALNERMEKIAPRCDWCKAGKVTDATL